MEFSLYVVTPAVVIAVSVVNCVVLLVGGAIAGFIWRNKYTEKKIRGCWVAVAEVLKASLYMPTFPTGALIATSSEPSKYYLFLSSEISCNQDWMSLLVIISIGYMALKYLAYGQLTEKADVYSFRVLLLEIKLVELPMDMMSKRILVKNLYLTQLSCNLNQLLYVVHILLQAICISEER
ncbi:hypothetical protein LINPERPRIM_LOCUS5650, partial [Linum perenne]